MPSITSFAAILFLFCGYTAAGFGGFDLQTVGTSSYLPSSVYLSNPDYYAAWLSTKDNAYNGFFPTNSLGFTGTQANPGLADGNTTWLTSYSTSPTFTAIDRIQAIPGLAAEAAYVGFLPGKQSYLGVVQSYVPLGAALCPTGGSCLNACPFCSPPGNCTTNPVCFCPICNALNTVYGYYANAGGVFNHTPNLQYAMTQVDPAYYTATISYEGPVQTSNDGNYMAFTYATGLPPAAFGGACPFGLGAVNGQCPFILGSQRMGIMSVGSNGTSLSVVTSIALPSTGVFGFTYFPQYTSKMTRVAFSTKYRFAVLACSYNLATFQLLNTPSAVFLFMFDSATGILSITGNASLPGLGFGVALDDLGTSLTTFNAAVGSPSVYLNPIPSVSSLPAPNDNVRVYSINSWQSNALSFYRSMRLDGYTCQTGMYSPDSSFLVFTCTVSWPDPVTIPDALPNLFAPTTQAPIPSTLYVATIDWSGINIRSTSATAYFAAAIDVSPDNSLVLSAGSDLVNIGGANLFSVN